MIIRTYHCDNCDQEFEVTCNSNDPDPDCPMCSKVLDWRPGMFSIPTNVSRAVDVTQRIMEEEYGHTNFRDNMREGDVAVIAPAAPSTAKRDEVVQQVSEYAQQRDQPLNPVQAQMASGFWGGAAGAMPTISAADILASAKTATAQANAEGVNPMKVLHGLGKSGKLPMKINIVARAKL